MSLSDSDFDSDIEDTVNEAILTSVPEKSKSAYEMSYNHFEDWLTENDSPPVNEKVLLAYFLQKSLTKAPTTLWTEYSKLRTMIYLNKNVNISNFMNLNVFLKRKSAGYIPKKSKVFTPNDMEKFLIDADDHQYLLMKV